MRWFNVNWEQLLGSGGEGSVYLAVDVHNDERCAIKVPHMWHLAARVPGVRAALRQQVEVEAARYGRMRGDRIVRLLGYNIDGDIPFLALEFAARGSLRDEIEVRRQQRQVLPVDLALATLEEVLLAIRDMHRSGVVHRDVKPENLLRFADWRLKLADLGLGRSIARPLDLQTRAILGTPGYAAPEQNLAPYGFRVDGRADLYAAGVILHELVTNTRPSSPHTPPRLAHQLGTTQGFDRYLARLLAFNVAARPATVDVALHELAQLRMELRVDAMMRVIAPQPCARCGRVLHQAPCPGCGRVHCPVAA
jgi:serine/threonine protein kinase